MNRAPRPRSRGPDRSSRPRADRGVLGLLRLLVFVALLGTVAVGAVVYGPTLVEELDATVNSVEVDDPPQVGDRNPDLVDPDDPGTSTYEATHTTFTSDDVEDFVHVKINEVRDEHGLDPLEWDGTIASVSRAHSADMHHRDYFAHENPDGEEPMDRFQDVSNYCMGYGENLAENVADQRVENSHGEVVRYRTPEELADGLVEQWMNSPDHRAAIVEDGEEFEELSWDRAGVGVYLSEEGRVYAAQNFCVEK